jgi:NTE family protein
MVRINHLARKICYSELWIMANKLLTVSALRRFLFCALAVSITTAWAVPSAVLAKDDVEKRPDECGLIPPPEPVTDRPTIGLALGGGGMRGAAHVGVLRVLLREGIPIDYIAGTSMGSVVGGLLASGVHPDEIEKRFTEGSLMHSFLTVPLSVRVAAIPIFVLPRLFGVKGYEGFYKGKKFRNYLNRMVPQCSREIEALPIPFCAVAVNLLDGQEVAVKQGNLGRAMQASCAVPILRRPVAIDDKLLVDGGVLVNLPVQHVRDMGADIVIAVDVDERPGKVDQEEFKRLGSVAHRVLTLSLWKIDEKQRQAADVLINPEVNGIGLISVKKEDARHAIRAGEKAAEAMVAEIKRKINEKARKKALGPE